MSVLYFGNDLTLPSVLWMRRMLEALGPDVATLVTEVDPGPRYRDRYEIVMVREGPARFGWSLARRLHLIPSYRITARAADTLRAAVESDQVDVVLMHYLTDGVKYDRVWRRTSKKVFIHCHGYDVTWDMRIYGQPDQLEHAADYVDRVRALPEHVHFITNSKRTTRRLLDIDIPEERIHLKYLGVPIPEAPPSRRDRDGELKILFLGRLVDFKGPELVIQAFDLASQRGLEGRLLMAGDGPMMAQCRELRDRSEYRERIELLGAVDAATGEELRQAADIFTAHNRKGELSNQEEAFGVSVVEAMAAGLPVVTGRNSSIPELYADGDEGFLLEPGDVEGHAEAFLKLAADPELRARMGQRGFERARGHFSIAHEMVTLRRILGLKNAENEHPGTVTG